MADLDVTHSSQMVSVVGTDANGAETNTVRASSNHDLGTVDVLVDGGTQGAITVGVAAVEAKVGAAKYTGRKNLTVCPTDGTIYWGFSNAVTTSTGIPLYKDQVLSIAASDTAAVWLIAGGNVNVRVAEGA